MQAQLQDKQARAAVAQVGTALAKMATKFTAQSLDLRVPACLQEEASVSTLGSVLRAVS